LVLRRLREEYVREYDLPAFIRAHYDLVLLVEKGLDEWRSALGDLAQEVPPILIRSAEELLPPEEARARLRCPGDGPVVLGVGAGDAHQAQRFLMLLVKAWARCGLKGHLRLATAQTLPSGPWDPFLINYYPLFELFQGVSLVVGACGYNLFHETQAAGVPALFLPQRRLYDDQFARATSAVVAHDPHQLEHFLRTALTDPATRPAPSFVNGAEVAADGLMRCAAA
jgi:UDP:flavonoid glycosyltransferase YjiC (YdhE family)